MQEAVIVLQLEEEEEELVKVVEVEEAEEVVGMVVVEVEVEDHLLQQHVEAVEEVLDVPFLFIHIFNNSQI